MKKECRFCGKKEHGVGHMARHKIIDIIGVIFYLRSTNPEFPFFWVMFSVIVLGIVALFVFFGKNIINFIKGLFSKTSILSDTQITLTDEQLMEEADKIISSSRYENHIKKFKSTIPYSSGKNLIKIIHVDLLFGHGGTNKAVILINANDVKRYSVIFEGDKIPRHYLEECLNPEIEYIIVPTF